MHCSDSINLAIVINSEYVIKLNKLKIIKIGNVLAFICKHYPNNYGTTFQVSKSGVFSGPYFTAFGLNT